MMLSCTLISKITKTTMKIKIGLKCPRTMLRKVGWWCSNCQAVLFNNHDGALHLTPSGRVFKRPPSAEIPKGVRPPTFEWLKEWVRDGEAEVFDGRTRAEITSYVTAQMMPSYVARLQMVPNTLRPLA